MFQPVGWILFHNIVSDRGTDVQEHTHAQKYKQVIAKPLTSEVPIRKEIAGGMYPIWRGDGGV